MPVCATACVWAHPRNSSVQPQGLPADLEHKNKRKQVPAFLTGEAGMEMGLCQEGMGTMGRQEKAERTGLQCTGVAAVRRSVKRRSRG